MVLAVTDWAISGLASTKSLTIRAKADGVVTPKERKHLNKMADKLSEDIYREKYDKQTAAPKP